MLMVVGVLAALREAERSGQGQVVDAAMVDGASLLMQMVWQMRARNMWADEREANLLDATRRSTTPTPAPTAGTSPWGRSNPSSTRPCSTSSRSRRASSPASTTRRDGPPSAAASRSDSRPGPRDEWTRVFADTDACVMPVLGLDEVADHPHIVARATVVTRGGVTQAAPAPRFSRTPAQLPAEPRSVDGVAELLAWWPQRR